MWVRKEVGSRRKPTMTSNVAASAARFTGKVSLNCHISSEMLGDQPPDQACISVMVEAAQADDLIRGLILIDLEQNSKRF